MTPHPPSTTVGVTGQRWRASVSAWGAVTPWDGHDDALDWFVAADDRWHRPAEEAAVRQRRIDGTPVVETRMRVPDGDAVHRVWAVASNGGLTIIEVENDSPLPFAVAFAGRPVATERPPADVPIEGIDLPADTIVLPVGHRATVRVGILHDTAGTTGEVRRHGGLGAAPGADAVVRGWLAVTGRAGRIDAPEERLADAVTAARCDLLLEGPIDADTDPVGNVLDVGELVRCGEPADAWLQELVVPLEVAARTAHPRLAAALDAGERVAVAAGDDTAAGDIARLRARVRPAPRSTGPLGDVERTASAGAFVHDVERRFASRGDLLPGGIPAHWRGVNFEVHDIPTSARSTVSYAVRWHGARPAVLWEQAGEPQVLTAQAVAPQWSTDAVSGDALWPAPPDAAGPPGPAPDVVSFS